MKPRLSLFITSVCFPLLLSSCEFYSKVGGPCSYISATDKAQVTQLNSSYVMLKSGYNQYEVKMNMFSPTPQMNDWYELEYSQITQGSCTPVIIKSVSKVN